MARMRSVKPEFWTDLKLARISRDARLLYIALWNQADEWGRVHGDSRYVKGHCLPYDDDLPLSAIDHLLDELADAGRVVRYVSEGDPYLYLPTLGKHQRLEPAKVPSRLPPPPSDDDPDEGNRRSEGMSESRANESARRTDESAPRANSSETIVAKHVAGSRLHVAGGMGAAQPRADESAQAVVAAYVDGATSTGRPPPSGRLCGKVGKDAKRLNSEGRSWADLTVAASRMGAAGWDDLDREMQKPTRGRPASTERALPTAEDYLTDVDPRLAGNWRPTGGVA